MKDHLLENADSEGNLWCHSEEYTDTCGPETGFHQLVLHEISKYVDVQQFGMKQHPFTFQRTGNEYCFNSITPSIGEGSRCGWKEALETSGLTYIKAILPLLSYHRQIALF